MNYRISLWSYEACEQPETLEEAIREVTEAGYGVELWPSWKSDKHLFAPGNRERLKKMLHGVPSSLHSFVTDGIEEYFEQIDAASESECDVLVAHQDQLRVADTPDYVFASEVASYAREKRVTLALENGELPNLLKALDKIPDLGICLDVGHVYVVGISSNPMKEYVDALKWNIKQVHLQDLYLVPGTRKALYDAHRPPGTCDIPAEDYEYLLKSLEIIGFTGSLVLEARPLSAVETLERTKALFSGKKERATF